MSSNSELVCSECARRFGNKSNLNKHLKDVHNVYTPRPTSLKCPTCRLSFDNFVIYEEHLADAHEFVPDKETLSFTTRDEFQTWRLSVEEKDMAKFVIRTSKNLRNKQVAYYRCHRSGPARYRRDDKSRKRLVKVQGSCKTNSHCPAVIKASFHPDGLVNVEFQRTHFGHAAEPVHLTIPSEVKESIAEKLRNRVPIDQILEEARNDRLKDDAQAKRVHRLTMADLRNIARKFDLDKSLLRRTPYLDEDRDNLDFWVALKEREARIRPSPILFYKPIHRSSTEYPKLGKDDFFIALMSSEQEKVLCEGNFETVCLLSSCGANPSAYRLATIAVLDDEKRQIPCAYFITNRMDSNMMEIFLNLVRARVGQLRPTVFLSEDGNLMQEVWECVMGRCGKSFYCPWYILQTWENTLFEMVIEADERKKAYDNLHSLLKESNAHSFPTLLMRVAHDLVENEPTAEFGGYFIREFVENCDMWACCYCKACGIDTTSHLDSMHEEIERVIGQGKPIKKLHITIQALLEIAESKLHEPIEVVVKEMTTQMLVKNLRRRHKVAMSMDVEKVSRIADGTWEVFSSSKTASTVSLVNSSCSCSINCVYCKACIHTYTCSCVDGRIKGNMCRHIHLVCLSTNSSLRQENKVDQPIVKADDCNKSATEGSVVNYETICEQNGVLIIDTTPDDESAPEEGCSLKHRLIGTFFATLSNCDALNELDILQQHLDRAQAEISSIKCKTSASMKRPSKGLTVILEES